MNRSLIVFMAALLFAGGCDSGEARNAEEISKRKGELQEKCVAAVAADVLVCLWAEGLPATDATECAALAIARWDCNGGELGGSGFGDDPDLWLGSILPHTVITCNVDMKPLAAGVWRWRMLEDK